MKTIALLLTWSVHLSTAIISHRKNGIKKLTIIYLFTKKAWNQCIYFKTVSLHDMNTKQLRKLISNKHKYKKMPSETLWMNNWKQYFLSLTVLRTLIFTQSAAGPQSTTIVSILQAKIIHDIKIVVQQPPTSNG